MRKNNQKGFGIVLVLDILFVVFGIIILIYLINQNWGGFQGFFDSLKSFFKFIK